MVVDGVGVWHVVKHHLGHDWSPAERVPKVLELSSWRETDLT
jgi:hypothetical protein